MAVRNTLIGAHLWLPVSMIEIAFRNLADVAISRAHPKGANWLFETGQKPDGSINGYSITGPTWLRMQRGDGSVEDPVRIAGGMAQTHSSRGEIQRDDLIANLMLGFWVVRVPEGLAVATPASPALDVFALVAELLKPPLDDAAALKRHMVNDILRIRNRLAHHEPLLFRRKHTMQKKTQAAKQGHELVSSLQGAIRSFRGEAEKVVSAARIMAPIASEHLDLVMAQLTADLDPLDERLEAERLKFKTEREARLAAFEAAKKADQTPKRP